MIPSCFLALLLWLATTAYAVTVNVCIQIETDFADAAPDITVYDDYIHSNNVARALRGVLIEVTDTDANPDVVTLKYADHSGSSAGCAEFTLTAGKTHTIRMWSKSKVGSDHIIEVRAGPGLGMYYKQWTATYEAPLTADTVTYTQNGGQQWGILTVASWAIDHRAGGLSNETWTLYNAVCPTTGGGCFSCDADGDSVAASDCYGGTDTDDVAAVFVGFDVRLIIAHELGHYLFRKRNEGGGGGNSDLAPTSGCHYVTTSTTGHEYQSKEGLAEAYYEGFASFYGAVTFNDESGSDCFVHYYKDQNFDLDADEDPGNGIWPIGQTGINCAGVPEKLPDGSWPEPADQLSSAIHAWDYLDDCVNGLSMGGAIANRGTELDMVRFWFALYRTSTWSFTDIVDVYDAANPHQWIGTSDTDTDLNNPPALPTPTIEDVLNTQFSSFEASWLTNAAVHGVDR